MSLRLNQSCGCNVVMYVFFIVMNMHVMPYFTTVDTMIFCSTNISTVSLLGLQVDLSIKESA
jgi:hypothetical protein